MTTSSDSSGEAAPHAFDPDALRAKYADERSPPRVLTITPIPGH